MDPVKIAGVRDWPTLKNVTEVSVVATQTRSQLKAEVEWASSQVVVELKG